MALLCLGALLAGLVAALVMPFLPFACAVMAAIAIGSVSTVVTGLSPAQTALSPLALLLTSQIGFGLGLVSAAVVGHLASSGRRAGDEKGSANRVPPLRTGNEPL